MLYASAHPFVDFREALKNYERLPLNPDVREKVMYKNAAKLLGIAEPQAAQAGGQQLEKIIIETVLKELAKRGMVAG